MKYALFLGCTEPTKARNYELSTRRIAEAVGMELIDLPEFECCGFPVKSVHYESFILMAARNLIAAEDAGLNICVLCSACAGTLVEVSRHLADHDQARQNVLSKLGKKDNKYGFAKNIKVKHLIRILHEEIGLEKLQAKIKKSLSGVAIAPHYGCHYLKPSEIYDNYDDPENPRSLDELIQVTGAKVVDYPEKERCCGAGVLAINEDLALSMAQKKLNSVKATGADAIVLMCPFCGAMYDENQKRIEAKFQTSYDIPVLYYTQLLGLALGIDQEMLGFNMNKVKADRLLAPSENVIELDSKE
jgi:heterodisulfide reductase subunit B